MGVSWNGSPLSHSDHLEVLKVPSKLACFTKYIFPYLSETHRERAAAIAAPEEAGAALALQPQVAVLVLLAPEKKHLECSTKYVNVNGLYTPFKYIIWFVALFVPRRVSLAAKSAPRGIVSHANGASARVVRLRPAVLAAGRPAIHADVYVDLGPAANVASVPSSSSAIPPLANKVAAF